MLKLDNYMPTFRNVLLKEVKEDKTAGGIYIPLSAKRQDETLYEVVKVGKDCTEVMPDHQVYLGPHSSYTTRVIEGQEYLVVNEVQIEGKFSKPASWKDFEAEEPEPSKENAQSKQLGVITNGLIFAVGVNSKGEIGQYLPMSEEDYQKYQSLDDDSFRTPHPSKPETTGSSLI